ncbi:hypothetical protein B0H14DRAFT_2940813, partial [Mycena olivaceomarginata]
IVAGNSTRRGCTCAHPAYEAPDDVDRGASASIDRTDVLPGCSFVQRSERDGGGGDGASAGSRCEYMHGYISCSCRLCIRSLGGAGDRPRDDAVLSASTRLHSTLLNPLQLKHPLLITSPRLDSIYLLPVLRYAASMLQDTSGTPGLIPRSTRHRFA